MNDVAFSVLLSSCFMYKHITDSFLLVALFFLISLVVQSPVCLLISHLKGELFVCDGGGRGTLGVVFIFDLNSLFGVSVPGWILKKQSSHSVSSFEC